MHANNLSIVRELQRGPRPRLSPTRPAPARPPRACRRSHRRSSRNARPSCARPWPINAASWLQTLLGQPATVLAERDGTGHAENFASVSLPPAPCPAVGHGDAAKIIEGMLA
jgi:threonylcarbamoyladenosine tRNA methylthiotransferase MtaB